MHPDRSRVELYNLTASVAEFDSLHLVLPNVVDYMVPALLAWEASMFQSPPDAVVQNAGCGESGGAESWQWAVEAELGHGSPYELA